MNGSHQSLDELYECSHENLNALVEIGKVCSVGIRLTGAGYALRVFDFRNLTNLDD